MVVSARRRQRRSAGKNEARDEEVREGEGASETAGWIRGRCRSQRARRSQSGRRRSTTLAAHRLAGPAPVNGRAAANRLWHRPGFSGAQSRTEYDSGPCRMSGATTADATSNSRAAVSNGSARVCAGCVTFGTLRFGHRIGPTTMHRFRASAGIGGGRSVTAAMAAEAAMHNRNRAMVTLSAPATRHRFARPQQPNERRQVEKKGERKANPAANSIHRLSVRVWIRWPVVVA
jgi:hypothetical protein